MSTPIGVQALVRRTHEDRVLQVLRERGALTRTTLSEITANLLARVTISATGPAGPIVGRGRPAERLQLDPDAGQYMGVDFRHSAVRVALANAARELIASDTAAYDTDSGWDARIEAAFDLIDRMSRTTGIHVDGVHGIAVGLPGPFSSRVPHDDDQPVEEARRAGAALVRTAFAERYGADVLLDNNTRLAALGEAAWHGGDVDHLLYLRLSYGVGGGLVIDGRLVSGSTGIAGEFGHVTVNGVHTPCRCGLGTAVAIPVGFLMGWCVTARALIEPWIQFFRTIPPLGLGASWATFVAAELIAAQQGLGYRMQQAQLYYRIDTIFVGLIVIGVLGLIMDRLLLLAERRLTGWQERR